MALFYHGLNQTELALRHMSRTLRILSLSSGSDHPDVAATFINVAMMYQDIGNMKSALRYLQEALKKNERLLGPDHIQTAVCYHALAIAFNCMGAYKLSIQACILGSAHTSSWSYTECLPLTDPTLAARKQNS